MDKNKSQYSKANLEVGQVASTNPFDAALNGVQFDPDGGTVACNGNSLVAVGPTKADTHFPDVGERATPGQNGVVLKPDFVAEVKGIIPKDKRVSLQHVAMTVCSADPSKTEFCTIDKTGRTRKVAEWPRQERFPDWRKVVRKALTPKLPGGKVTRVCVGRKSLLAALKTLIDASGDGSDSPVFLEIGAGVVMRAVNRETGQHIVAVAAALNAGDEWMKPDAWENGIYGEREIPPITAPAKKKLPMVKKKLPQ